MLQPTYDHVLVAVDESESVSAGGIILTENSALNRTLKAKVLATGPGVYQNGILVPVRIAVGSTVVFLREQGIKLAATENQGETLMLREGDIIGVL